MHFASICDEHIIIKDANEAIQELGGSMPGYVPSKLVLFIFN